MSSKGAGTTVADMQNWTSRCKTEENAAAVWQHKWGCVFDKNADVGELGHTETTEEKARF